MLVSVIVAVSHNNVIGRDNQLPWRLPADLQYFKRVTTGHHIILGRKNYQSIGRPLPNRVNLVLSRDAAFVAPGCVVVPSLEVALQHAKEAGETECFIIGGAQVYAEALPLASRLYLTRVDADVEGDVKMPALGEGWHEEWSESHEADERNVFAYSFKRFVRNPE